MKLSFCAIVKNEEAALPSCLSSVKDVVDEMVVLDTGSSDRTCEIATEFGAKVYHFEWGNDFSAARNESLKYVQGDWILVLDADELLTPTIIPQLQTAIKSDRHIAINLVRQEIGASQSPYSLVSRLFRRHPEVYFSRPYHAMVDDSIQILLQREPEWQIGYLADVAILHYGYQPGAIAALNKFARARAAMEGFLATHPNEPYVCSKLGALYVQMGEISKGIELLERGLGKKEKGKRKKEKARKFNAKSRSGFTEFTGFTRLFSPIPNPQSDAAVLYELHYHLGNAYTRIQKIEQAATHYQAAIQQPILLKLKLGAYNNLGNLLMAVGDLNRAKTAYETTLQIDPGFVLGMYNLGMVLKAMGEFEQAIASYRQAIHLNPNYAEAYQNLGVTLLKIGKVPESLAAFQEAIALHSQHNPSEAERLRQGLEEMGFHIDVSC